MVYYHRQVLLSEKRSSLIEEEDCMRLNLRLASKELHLKRVKLPLRLTGILSQDWKWLSKRILVNKLFIEKLSKHFKIEFVWWVICFVRTRQFEMYFRLSLLAIYAGIASIIIDYNQKIKSTAPLLIWLSGLSVDCQRKTLESFYLKLERKSRNCWI